MTSPAFTNLTASGASSSASFNTASVSPAGNQLILVSVHAYISTGSTAPPTPTVTGNGITYTLIGSGQDVDTAGTDRAKMWIFRGMAASPTTGAITIAFGSSMTRCWWSVDQSDANVDTTGTNGSGAIAHDPPDGFTSSSTVSTISVTYAGGAISTGNSGFAAVCSQTNQAKTPRSGWTELADTFPVTTGSMETQYVAGSDTAASATWTTAARAAIIALEVVGATSGSSFTQTPADTEAITDSGVTYGHSETGTDPLALSDTEAYAQGKGVTDNLSLSDSVLVIGPQKYLTGVSSNGRYFVDQAGAPFLVRGESPWAMFTKLPSSEMDAYLGNRASYGCNTMLVSMIGATANGAPADTGATYDGVLPFTGGDPTVFNSAYWSRMDSYIAKARDLGITLMIYPMDGWNTAFASVVFNPGSITNTQCQTYGQTLATRYLSYPNIIWSFGGDYNEDSTINARFNACLTGIRAAGDTRPVTIQLLYETSESDNSTFWEPKVDFDFCYTYYVTYKSVSDGYNHTYSTSPTTRPAVLGEAAYENSGSPHPGTDLAIRRQAGWALTSGSPGEFTGQEGVWNFQSGWASTLDTTAAVQLKAIRDAVQGVAWWSLVPDDSNQLVTAGRGTRVTTDSATFPSGNTYVTAGRASDGSLAVIYLPNASSAITVDMSKIGSSPTATWVDPTNGATTTATVGSSYSKGNNAAGSTDWFLILTGTPTGSNFTQSPTDSEGLTDQVALTLVKAVTDSLGLSDLTAESLSDVLAETLGLADAAALGVGLGITDQAGLSDSVLLEKVLAQTPADTLGLTDTAAVVGDFRQAPSDGLGLTDAAQVSLAGAGSIGVTDNAALTDAQAIDQTHTVADQESLSDSVAFGADRGAADIEATTDTASISVDRAVLDAETLTDAVQLTMSGGNAVTDSLNVTDATVFDQRHTYTDQAGLTDPAGLVLASARAIVDAAALSDAAEVVLMLPPTSGTAQGANGPAPTSGPGLGQAPTASGVSMLVPSAIGG